MMRRRFLVGCGSGLAALVRAGGASGRSARAAWGRGRDRPAEVIEADVAVIGGGLGGCAAALAALRAGRTVVLTEPTDWVGGQLTSQAVPPDEHPWIEQFGRSASYAGLRRGIRDYYRAHYPLTAEALADPRLDPGNGSVSALCHEPRAALAVLTALLAPHASTGRLLILLEHVPDAAEVEGDHVRSVRVVDRLTGDRRSLVAPYFLDATELGDLLPLAGVEHVTGFESQAQTDEPSAPAEARPDDQQAFTCCFAMEYRPAEDHTIDRPAEYERWRTEVPALDPPWPGPLLSLTYTHPVTLEPITREMDPSGAGAGLWVYRRIVDPANFRPGAYRGSTGVSLVNWPQNDYWLGNLIPPSADHPAATGADRAAGVGRRALFADDVQRHVDRAGQLSLSLLHWLQTEAPRPDGGAGWKGLKLRPDLVGTADGLAKHPYVRESRRIRAEFTVKEQQIGTVARAAALGLPVDSPDLRAERFPDSVGVGSYRIDLHPSTGGRNYLDVSSLPFQVPLGSLIPIRVENVLPACKNLGVTHITNGCYRLHPVEWAVGEAAGALAAFCLERDESPRAVRSDPGRLADFQAVLGRDGVEIDWPRPGPR